MHLFWRRKREREREREGKERERREQEKQTERDTALLQHLHLPSARHPPLPLTSPSPCAAPDRSTLEASDLSVCSSHGTRSANLCSPSPLTRLPSALAATARTSGCGSSNTCRGRRRLIRNEQRNNEKPSAAAALAETNVGLSGFVPWGVDRRHDVSATVAVLLLCLSVALFCWKQRETGLGSETPSSGMSNKTMGNRLGAICVF